MHPSKQLTVYIAGPMTGLINYNYHSFRAAADYLRLSGYQVRNPATYDTDWNDHTLYVDLGLKMMDGCNAICLLPGWMSSTGAIAEARKAYDNKFTVVHLPTHMAQYMQLLYHKTCTEPRKLKPQGVDIHSLMFDLPVITA